MPRGKFSLFDRLPEEQRAKMLGGDRYKLGALINRITPHVIWDAIETGEPYQVRSLVVFASNTLCARENATRVYATGGIIVGEYDLFKCGTYGDVDYWWSSNLLSMLFLRTNLHPYPLRLPIVTEFTNMS